MRLFVSVTFCSCSTTRGCIGRGVTGLCALIVATPSARLNARSTNNARGGAKPRRCGWPSLTCLQAKGSRLSVQRVEMPIAMLPDTVVSNVEDNHVARQFIAAGEVLVVSDVAPTTGPAALLPPDWVGCRSTRQTPACSRQGIRRRSMPSDRRSSPTQIVVAVGDGVVVVGVHGDVAARVADAAQQRLATRGA